MFNFFSNPTLTLTKEYCIFVQEASKGQLRDVGGWVLNLKVKYLDSVILGLNNGYSRDELGNSVPLYYPRLPKEVLDKASNYIKDYIQQHELEEISIIDVARFLAMSGVIHFYGEEKYTKYFHKIDKTIHNFNWLFKKNPYISVVRLENGSIKL